MTINKSNKKDDKYPAANNLPEMSLILINDNNKIKIKSLDDHPDEAQIKRIYLLTIDKYGANNVRYCKVVSADIKIDVNFI